VRRCAADEYENQEYCCTEKVVHRRLPQTLAFDSEFPAYTLPNSLPGRKQVQGAHTTAPQPLYAAPTSARSKDMVCVQLISIDRPRSGSVAVFCGGTL
jgi:hypothetical protein